MLTKLQLQEIQQLQQECEAYDHLQLKLNWDMLANRESEQLDLLFYENKELIAFLGLYPFGSTVEVCGMVKPTKRRNGHFQRLFEQGMQTVKHNKYKKILLNAPEGSDAAKAFLIKQGATYVLSEHQMEWQERAIEEVNGVTVRQATDDDFDMQIRLSVEAFGYDEDDSRAMELMFNEDANSVMFMIEANGEAVGKIRVNVEGGQLWIYGFSILPEHQGKGIGRKALHQVIRDHSSTGRSIHLEVETKNEHALGLYESVGFKAVHAQDYYSYQL